MTDQEKIAIAKKAISDYIQAMYNLTHEQRQILINGMSRYEKKEINKIKEEIENI